MSSSNTRSSIFNAAAALGEALGPTLGTWLLAHGFQVRFWGRTFVKKDREILRV